MTTLTRDQLSALPEFRDYSNVRMQVRNLEGILLDYWAAKANGDDPAIFALTFGERCHRPFAGNVDGRTIFQPTERMDQAMEIIVREKIGFLHCANNDDPQQQWVAGSDASCGEYWSDDHSGYYGPTPLIAAMRCFVGSKFGDTVPPA